MALSKNKILEELRTPFPVDPLFRTLEELEERFGVAIPTVHLNERETRRLGNLARRYRNGEDVAARIIERYSVEISPEVRS